MIWKQLFIKEISSWKKNIKDNLYYLLICKYLKERCIINIYKCTLDCGLLNCINCSSLNSNSNGSNIFIENGLISGCNIYNPSALISFVLKL